jgi:ATP-dependent Lon protease
MKPLKYKTTKDIKVSKSMIEQVIGQEKAVNIIKKAAKQRRHVLLIGEPGTGKSMLGVALSQLLPQEALKDIISLPNPNDENQPLIRVLPKGKGREFIAKAKLESLNMFKGQNVFLIILLIISMIVPWWTRWHYLKIDGAVAANIMFAAMFLGSMFFFGAFMIFLNLGKKVALGGQKVSIPKLIVDNFGKQKAPFFDATGAHAGALLGDVLHDPFQSGGLGTPAHERIIAGMIHKAHMGVLFVDEIATLQPATQQELLTALQEGKYAITGQSERSAGAMVMTEPVPCNFILIAAGNYDTLTKMHPALRSRIKGYGYEIYMEETMPETQENRDKIAIFVAQEVTKDQKIPHFEKDAVNYIIDHAKKMASRKGHLTLRFRELGGIVRAAGDIAQEEKAQLVTKEHVQKAKLVARSLEKQIADQYIERKKEYEVISNKGTKIGRINGLAVMGDRASMSGIVLPIESEVTPGGKESEIIATGKLGEIAKEAIKNVSAIIKRYFGEDIKNKYDIYVQFLQTYEGVEGDSASIAVAVSIISALKELEIKQDFAVTGSLSVRGKVLPVGGVSSKVEAALEGGFKNVIVPKSNLGDIIIEESELKKINLIPVETLSDVLKEILVWKPKDKPLLNKILKNRNV